MLLSSVPGWAWPWCLPSGHWAPAAEQGGEQEGGEQPGEGHQHQDKGPDLDIGQHSENRDSALLINKNQDIITIAMSSSRVDWRDLNI